MILLATVALAAIGAGYLFGGRLRRMETLRLRWWGLAPVGFAMQVAPLPVEGEGGGALAVGLLIASYVLLIGFCVLNVRTAGFPLLILGLAMNMLVISANGGMPVSGEALVRSGQGDLLEELQREDSAKHHLQREDDVLLFLADVIPIPPPIHQVVSAGDLVVYAGVIWLVAAAMRGRATPGAVGAGSL